MLNKTVWMLWLQGWDTAPWLVRQAAETWEINNPDWRVERVTLANLGDYVDDIDYIHDPAKEIAPPTKSDIIRLSLLKNHGGVWADATLLCMQPLAHWLETAVRPAGLWMYHGDSPAMRVGMGPAIWFIAAETESPMIRTWKEAGDAYWAANNRIGTYFWLDAMFGEQWRRDADFRAAWASVPYLHCSAKGQAQMLVSRVGNVSRLAVADPEAKAILDKRPPYVLKLCWKRWQAAFPDLEDPRCRDSNGRFAIAMARRGDVVFRHPMRDKGTAAFRASAASRFLLKKAGGVRRRIVKRIGFGTPA